MSGRLFKPELLPETAITSAHPVSKSVVEQWYVFSGERSETLQCAGCGLRGGCG